MTGFQDTGLVVGGSRTSSFFQYQRLESRNDDDGAASRRQWWRRLPALNGEVAPPCFLHVRKLKWSRIASAFLPKKVAELSSKIRRAADATPGGDDICPAVVFMSPWGLPVLSRPLLARNRGRVSAYPHGRDGF